MEDDKIGIVAMALEDLMVQQKHKDAGYFFAIADLHAPLGKGATETPSRQPERPWRERLESSYLQAQPGTRDSERSMQKWPSRVWGI